jgi:DNA/RNA-binding domain of Phe-tRNA-synthetase-like protein
MSEGLEGITGAGFIEPRLRAEFPGLTLDWVTVAAHNRKSPLEVKQRLRALSNRYRGGSVVAMRTQPIAHAYRSFFHQVGLDPDVTRIPSEQAAVTRLLLGGFKSRDLVEDALLIALIETGVPVWALDGDRVDAGGLELRTSVAGDRIGSGETATRLPAGRLVVADARCVHGLLFGEIAPAHRVGPRTNRVMLFAVGVEGIPAIHIEEALWSASEVLKPA